MLIVHLSSLFLSSSLSLYKEFKQDQLDTKCTQFVCGQYILQLMHSFEVNIRICQPENGEHHFRGLTNPDVNRKRMHQLFGYMTLSLISIFYVKSKEGNDQKSIKSITTPWTRYGKVTKHKETSYTREPRSQLFPSSEVITRLQGTGKTV